MADTSPGFLDLALTSQVIVPALKISLAVGTVLALINHGSAIFRMELGAERLLQIALTYLVPYCVSTYSAVKAIQGHEQTPT
jgi:hypothetical protein